MATQVYTYDNAIALQGQGLLDLRAIQIDVALIASTYTPNVVTDTVWADVVAHEIDDATYPNYVAGGKTLANQTFTQSGGVGKLSGDDMVWAGASITSRYAVARAVGTFETFTDPVLFYILFDDTPVDVSREDFTIKWSPTGVFSISKAS